jgi:hypothetical protein
MSSQITVAIKVKPYLKDYIIAIYGAEPVKITESNKLAPLFIKRLCKVPENYKPIKDYSDYILFELPFNGDKNIRYNNYIPDAKQKYVAEFFESECKSQFRMFMNENQDKFSGVLKDVIFEFMRIYDINSGEDTYETFKKDYYRFRIKIKKPLRKTRGTKIFKEVFLKKNTTTPDPILSL